MRFKSKRGSSSEAEELVDMDTHIPNEQQRSDPIEIEDEEQPSQRVPTSKNKGIQVARKYSQRG